ncbi:MAG: sulfatase-like hydrolase/transferase [Bacteroidota bacterium]
MLYKNTTYRLISLLLLVFASCADSEEQNTLPNILWVTTEDMSMELGCYGDAVAKTPDIDAFARKSLLYTNAFASAPVCAPARSSIITGMYPTSIGSHHMRTAGRIPRGVRYFPQYLREAGYYCTNNSKEDYNLDYESSAIWDESNDVAHWRNRKRKDQPFFAVFNYIGTHESGIDNERKHSRFTKDLTEDQFINPNDVKLPIYFPDTEITRKLWARYYSNISALDEYVAKLLRQLEEDGLSENTIVFFYSDHGAGVPIHKRWLFDTGLKVPLLVHLPEKYKRLSKKQMGSQTDELVSFVDLAPTVLKLAGLDIPEHMQGRAFLGNGLSPEREFVFAARDRMDERYDMQRAVRNKQFKYIRYYEPSKPYIQYMNTPEKGEIMKQIRAAYVQETLPEAGVRLMATTKPNEELFDLEKDPNELNNLIDDPQYKEVLSQMRSAHEEWSIRIKDAGLIPEPILRSWEKMHDKSIYELLREGVYSIDEVQRVALSEDLDGLQQGLASDNEAVRYWAAIRIGDHPEWKNAELLEILGNGLNDEDHLVRIASARALIKMGVEEKSFALLENELNSADEWIRLNAVLVLDEMGEMARPTINALQSVMEDPNKYVIRVANRALNNLLGTSNVVR